MQRFSILIVTFGYTTPYWNWPRWEKELDWMALISKSEPYPDPLAESKKLINHYNK